MDEHFTNGNLNAQLMVNFYKLRYNNGRGLNTSYKLGSYGNAQKCNKTWRFLVHFDICQYIEVINHECLWNTLEIFYELQTTR